MVGVEYVVDCGDIAVKRYSVEDDGGSSPYYLARRIMDDLRMWYPELVIYQSGILVDESAIEKMCRGERLLVWESEEAFDDMISHPCATIRCTRDLLDWIREEIGSPGHAWDRWVGSQTPEEFMGRAIGKSIVGAVIEYVDDIMMDERYLGHHQWVAEYLEVRDALIKALVDEIDERCGPFEKRGVR